MIAAQIDFPLLEFWLTQSNLNKNMHLMLDTLDTYKASTIAPAFNVSFNNECEITLCEVYDFQSLL
jgi:hypothetical protein